MISFFISRIAYWVCCDNQSALSLREDNHGAARICKERDSMHDRLPHAPTPSLSPSEGERVPEGRVRGGSWLRCAVGKSWALPLNVVAADVRRLTFQMRSTECGTRN